MLSKSITAEGLYISNSDIRTWSKIAQEDPYLLAIACTINVNNIHYVSKALRDDYLFMTILVRNMGQRSLESHQLKEITKAASKQLQNNPSFMMEIILHDPSAFKFAGKALASNVDFIRSVFNRDINIYPYLCKTMQRVPEFAKNAIRYGFPVQDLPKSVFNDKAVVKACLYYARAYEIYPLLPKELQKDAVIQTMYANLCSSVKR